MATNWTPRIRCPLLFVRGQDSYVELEVWYSGGRQEPASGTLTVYDDDDTVIVNAQAIVVSGGKATCTVLAATLPTTLELSENWRAVWALSLGGESASFHQDAQLIRRPWRATVTQGDVLSASPQLRNSYNPDSTDDNEALEEVIRAVVEDVQARLVGNGMRPWLIFDQWRVNRYTVEVVLGRLFRSHMFDQDPANLAMLDKLATHHEEAAELAWGALNFKYDIMETGVAGDVVQRKGPATIRIGITR